MLYQFSKTSCLKETRGKSSLWAIKAQAVRLLHCMTEDRPLNLNLCLSWAPQQVHCGGLFLVGCSSRRKFCSPRAGLLLHTGHSYSGSSGHSQGSALSCPSIPSKHDSEGIGLPACLSPPSAFPPPFRIKECLCSADRICPPNSHIGTLSSEGDIVRQTAFGIFFPFGPRCSY